MKKQSIIRRMAKLREQKKIVKLVYDCPEDCIKYSNGVTKRAIVGHFMDKPLFSGEKERNFKKPKEQNTIHRRKRDIETLIESCEPEHDNFIRPDFEVEHIANESEITQAGGWGEVMSSKTKIPSKQLVHDDGYYATSRGTDLLNFVGFCTRGLEKYSIWQVLFTSSVLAALIGYLMANMPAWFCKLLSVINLCHA